MDEEFLKQMFAELLAAQGQALGMVVTAACQQLDPARFTTDLRATIRAHETSRSTSPTALRIATEALAAADAARMLQAKR